MTDLKDTLLSIARTPEQFGFYEHQNDPNPDAWRPPHSWTPDLTSMEPIKDGDYGQFYDFEVFPNKGKAGGDVFYADSVAAWKWANKTFPDYTPRWRDRGFVITEGIVRIMAEAEKAGLVNKQQPEDDNTRRQWD